MDDTISNLNAQLKLAKAYHEMGRTMDGDAILDELRNSPNLAARVSAAEEYFRLGREPEAQAILDDVGYAPDTSPKARILAAEAYHRLGRPTQCESILNELRYGAGATIESKILVAEAYHRLGRSVEAAAMLDMLGHAPHATAKSRILAAEAYHRIGRASDAHAILDRIVYDPSASTESKLDVAEALQRIGRTDQAQLILDQLRLDPNISAESKILVAEAFLRTGRAVEAQSLLNELRYDPDASVESQILLAKAFHRMGREAEAESILERIRYAGAKTSLADVDWDDLAAAARPPADEASTPEADREQSQRSEQERGSDISAPPEAVSAILRSPIKRGRTLLFQRTPQEDELCLGVDSYAKVLARLFRLPDPDDFCLAIFGFWGRGKTFLLQQTAKFINAGFLESDRYETVFFSAWKYPSRPEVWIHLYETVFQSLRAHGWWKSLAYIIRTGIARRGYKRLLIVWAALMFSAFPKEWLIKGVESYFRQLEGPVAIAAVVFCLFFGWRLWKTKFVLQHEFLKTPSHAEKLGLQATIGKDLAALLKGWVGVAENGEREKSAWILFWVLVLALVTTIQVRAGYAWEAGAFFSSFILVTAIAVALAFLQAAPSPRRILLVVDDLDRCQFEHLLTIVESVKMLLEDKAISRRLQVAVLVEEDVLQHAIWEKYHKLADKAASDILKTGYTGSRIVRENFEKLFTAHLRLGSLSAKDVSEMVARFARAQAGTSIDDKGAAPSTVTTQSTIDLTIVAPEQRQTRDGMANRFESELTTSRQSPTLSTFTDAVLSEDEKRAIRDELREMKDRVRGDLGPRAIRSFMFRYQLGRLILDELQITDWQPDVFVQLLAAKSLWEQADVPAAAESHPEVWAVVNQVG
jgi:hypothetical protein